MLQLNLIKSMAYMYKEYEAVRNVSFKPSFVIQGESYTATCSLHYMYMCICGYLYYSVFW